MLPRADMESAPTDRQACALNGSLCETDSPDTGEVARSARRGALSAKLTEGETNKLAPVKSKALSPTRLRGTAYAARPLCRFATSPRTAGSHPPRGGLSAAGNSNTPFSFSYFLHQLERPAPTRWAFRVCALKLLHHPCRGAHCAPANLTLHRLFHVSAP